jgi:hypothetical protein
MDGMTDYDQFSRRDAPNSVKKRTLSGALERAKGFEPSARNSESTQNQATPQPAQVGCTQIRAQILGELGPELARVVAAWSKLPAPLKAAILAIVNSMEDLP